jgi:2-iminobutanoate/2-iminopropanoate deaminase
MPVWHKEFEDTLMANKKEIKTDKAPSAIGPYSQAIRSGQWLYTAGAIPIEPSSGQLVGGGIKDKTRQVLENLKAIIEAGGGTMDDVVKTTIFLTSLQDFVPMNEVYGEYFQAPYPARSTVQVAALPKGVALEIEAIAYLSKAK